MEKLTELYQYGGMEKLSEMRDALGKWYYDPENSFIRRRKVLGRDSIGDLRISYNVPANFETGQQA